MRLAYTPQYIIIPQKGYMRVIHMDGIMRLYVSAPKKITQLYVRVKFVRPHAVMDDTIFLEKNPYRDARHPPFPERHQ